MAHLNIHTRVQTIAFFEAQTHTTYSKRTKLPNSVNDQHEHDCNVNITQREEKVFVSRENFIPWRY